MKFPHNSLFFPHNRQIFSAFFPRKFLHFFFFILSDALLKQLHIRLQNNVNYLGSKFLSTRYSNFWWFLSQSFILRCLQVTYDIHLPLLLFSLVIEKHVLKTIWFYLKCYSCEELRDVSHALRSCESGFSRPYTIKPSHKHWCWVLLLLSPTWLSRKLFLIPNHSKQVNFVTPNFQWADVTDKDKIGKGSIGSAIKAHYIPENSM